LIAGMVCLLTELVAGILVESVGHFHLRVAAWVSHIILGSDSFSDWNVVVKTIGARWSRHARVVRYVCFTGCSWVLGS
jgi:hypothetical protein